MFKLISTAVIAVSILGTPALAQGFDFFGTQDTPETQVSYHTETPTQWSSYRSRRAPRYRSHHNSHVAGGGNAHSIATQVAREEGISPALVHAVMKIESGGRCHVTSSGNAQGAMQVKPATARGVGVHGNLHDCRTGIVAGVRYLKQALAANGGNICAAASGYNMGIGVRGRCTGYGRKVMAAMVGRARYASLQANDE